MTMNRSDERKQTMYGASRPGRDPDDDDDDDTPNAKAGSDDDEAEDEGNETAPQGVRAGVEGSKARQASGEASEVAQKSRNMGGRGQKGGSDDVKMSQTATDSEEEGNPARMVNHGRGEAKGHEPEIEGAHQGSGDGGPPMHQNTLGHGEREAKMTGAHQGQHGSTSKTGSGWEK